MLSKKQTTDIKLENLTGDKLLRQHSRLHQVRYAFVINYRELRNFILQSEEMWPQLPVRDAITRYSSEKTRRLYEVSRLLYNFLAISMTLLEHSDEIVRKVLDSTARQAYNNMVNATFGTPLGTFAKELRNFSTHEQLPVVGARTVLRENYSFTVGFSLDKQKLSDRKEEWGKKSKKFMDILEDRIPIDQFVDSYYMTTKEFHIWLDNHFLTTQAERIKQERESKIEAIRVVIPPSLQDSHIRLIATYHPDILIDDNWTFDIFED